MKKEIKKIVLMTTQQCNLRCKYCYEAYKSNSFMEFRTAKRILDNELRNMDSYSKVIIEFIGGEPFLPQSFDLIKKVIEYIEISGLTENVSYVTTTNGTLLNSEIRSFLMRYSDRFALSLSLDGKKKSHDLNRIQTNGLGSYDLIDLDFFQKYPIPVTAKITVSPITLRYMAEDILFVSEELKFIPNATFATGIDWENEYNPYELIHQLQILTKEYSDRVDALLPLMFRMDLKKVFALPNPYQKPCGAGDITKTFMPDCIDNNNVIHWYPCQGLAPITLGNKKSRQFLDYSFPTFCLKAPCSECQFRALCPSCQATNYSITGDVGKQSRVMCLLNRLNMLAASAIKYNWIMKKEKQNITTEDQIILKAIQIIQTEVLDDTKHTFLWKNFTV